MANKPIKSVCKFGIVADIFSDHGKWFSEHSSVKKAGIVDPGRLLKMKFEQLFDRELDQFSILNLTKVDAKKFRDELGFVIKSIERGKVDNVLGEYLWSTQERARNAPVLAEVMNDFLNINHRRKGAQLHTDQLYSRILEGLGAESTRLGYHESSEVMGEKSSFKKSVKKAMKLEEKISDAMADAGNKLPGSQIKLDRAISEQKQFFLTNEGRVFHDFVNLIEKGLPKLQDKIDTQKAELIAKAKKKGKKLKQSEIRVEKISDLLTEISDSPFMRKALAEYVELTDYTWDRLDNGISKYIKTIQYGILSKGYSSTGGKYKTIEEIGKELRESLMPDKKLGYYPQYNYKLNVEYLDNLMPHMDKLLSSSRESLSKNEVDIDSAIKGVRGYISQRAKHRKKTSDNDYSFNFPAVLKKYTDEIIRFNFVNNSQAATRKALLELKNMYKDGKVIDGYGTDLIKEILDLNAAQTGSGEINHPEFNSFMRAVGNLEYSSKIGASFRTPAKNLTQRLIEVVYFGRKAQTDATKLYDNNPELLREVDRLMEESGIKFTSTTPELLEVAGSKGANVRLKISGMGEVEFTKASRIEKFADLTGKIAGSKIMSGMMQYTENMNRKGTFRVAFAKTYNELMTSPGFAELMALEGIRGEKLNKKIISMARNAAIKATSLVHFDYESIAKSKMLRSPVGRVMFQFQHYLQKMTELSKDITMDFGRSVQAGEGFKGKFNSVEAQRMYRLGLIYMLLPGILSGVTGVDVGNVIEFAPAQKLDQIATVFTGDEDEIKQKLFGRGAMGAVGFPAAGTILTIGELAELWRMDPGSWESMALGYNDYADATNDQKWYKLLRTINSQAGRAYGQTIPLMLGGDIGFAIQAELGAYPISKKKRLEKFKILTSTLDEFSPGAMNNLEQLAREIEEAHKSSTQPTS
tara:strand:+ start:14739 stop:17504 length:2766 start_codon:yes stop_codon:yes gene_type:complete